MTSTINICDIISQDFPNPVNPTLFAGFENVSPLQNSIRPWSREHGRVCLTNYSTYQLDMRRKAEILQYKNNNSNLSSRRLYSRKARGIGVEKQSWANQAPMANPSIPPIVTNNNTNNLQQIGFTLICPEARTLCFSTTASDVPGRPQLLCYNQNVPLVNYKVRTTYLAGSSKWPQTCWKPGDDGFPVGKAGNYRR